MEMKTNFSQRLRALRDARGLTQAALGSQLHKGESTVRMWELGKNEPDHQTLVALAEFFNVSVDYLLGRNVPEELPKEDRRLIKAFHEAPVKTKENVTYILRDQLPADNGEMTEVDFYTTPPIAGGEGDTERMTVSLPANKVPPRTSFAIMVNDDSMSPDYPRGCVAFVQGVPSIGDGECGVFAFDGVSLLRKKQRDCRTGSVFLTPLNPSGQISEVRRGREVVTIGRVVGCTAYDEKMLKRA